MKSNLLYSSILKGSLRLFCRRDVANGWSRRYVLLVVFFFQSGLSGNSSENRNRLCV